MKLWYGYGSEHSMNLVMIGHFKDTGDAAKAKEVIDRLTEQVNSDTQSGLLEIGRLTDHFTEGMLGLLQQVNFHNLGSAEVEQFCYDVHVKLDNDMVVITTNESDVSAFLKLLVDKGARVEVYSAHQYPDTGYGR